MTIPQTPIVNAPELYIYGLGLAIFNGVTFTVGSGAARNSSNINDMSLAASSTLVTCSRVGANGLDAGSLAASTFYAVHLIGDSTGYRPTACLVSLSAINPILPSGYDMFRRIGWARTDGSSSFVSMRIIGNSANRFYYYDIPLTILTGGNATTFATGSINLSSSFFVPPFSQLGAFSSQVNINIAFTPASATNVAEFDVANSSTAAIIRFGTGVAGPQVGNTTVPVATSPSGTFFNYRVSNAGDSLTLTIAGFSDPLGQG